MSRLLIVSEVGQHTRFPIKFVGPINVGKTGCESEHLELFGGSSSAKTALICKLEQSRKRIVSCIATLTTLVDCVHRKITRSEFVKFDHLSGVFHLARAPP